MSLQSRLFKYGFDLGKPRQFSDGTAVNFICFWSSSIPRGAPSDLDFNFKQRNPKEYSSHLTQINLIAPTSSYEQKLNNWTLLNKLLLTKLSMQIPESDMQKLIDADQETTIKFLDVLFQNLDHYNPKTAKPINSSIDTNEAKLQSSVNGYSIADITNKKKSGINESDIQIENSLRLSKKETRRVFGAVACPNCTLYQQKIKLLEAEVQVLREQLGLK